MARSDAIWAIDIGQCALKALRCRAHTAADRIIAEAFDYIEYPKILSQPGADAAELVDEALKQFLSRNAVRGDRVAISVSGQSGLARFIKLPPVEAKKIPDIVRYEARQQIPFDLNDVIWDYQRMGGGSEEEGFALETEIGLFAMKRDAVFRTLEPFEKAGIEVDLVQLAPLALYNFILFDQLTDLPPAEEYDPEAPPASVVVLSLGTDATDLVVTNGFRVWQRSIPLGGNHFTKALTKELKLTFAKAEHLKRNAAAAQDPKAVFQAMRPVFRDLLTELQRSIGYFTSIDRAAKISHVVALGNAMKLPGLRRYLAQSLGFEIHRLEEFRGLSGSQVLTAPAFKENSLCFGVCYGLAVQGVGRAGLRTNLLPKEILKDRLVRQKKPWAVAAAAAVLLACAISFGTYSHGLSNVEKQTAIGGTTWEAAERQAGDAAAQSAELLSQFQEAFSTFQAIDKIGRNLTGNVEGRLRWLELLATIDKCLPPYPGDSAAAPPGPAAKQPDELPKTAKELANEIAERQELHITGLRCEYYPDLSTWYQSVQAMNPVWFKPPAEKAGQPGLPGQPAPANPAVPAANPAVATDATATGAEPVTEGPTGAGWVVVLTGYHFHNFEDPRRPWGTRYVVDTLIKHLATAKVILPTADPNRREAVTTEELGIGYPVLVNPGQVQRQWVAGPGGGGEAPAGGTPFVTDPTAAQGAVEVRRFDFQVQFCWQPKTPTERQEAREKIKREAAAALAAQQ
jgi:type IV pilus assembly protein PilM